MEVLDDIRPLSKGLKDTIPPLKDGEVAVFRLTNAFVKEATREEPSCREVAQFSGVEKINDPFEKEGSKTKKIGTFIREYKQVGKTGQVKPIYEPPVFIRGEMRVGAENQAMYEFMMRSTKCGSNRFRLLMGAKKGSKPEWDLLTKKEITNGLNFEEIKWQAEKLVRESVFDNLKIIAATLNSSPDPRLKVASYNGGISVDPQGMKTELIQLARQYPKQIISASADEGSKIKVQVYDAMLFGILFYERKGYHLIEKDEMVELFTPESDIDSVDSLVAFLTKKENQKSYIRFAQALKNALKV